MSNRDGKGAKKRAGKNMFRIGKKCARCGKGTYNHCDQKNKEGHKHHAICGVCGHSNF